MGQSGKINDSRNTKRNSKTNSDTKFKSLTTFKSDQLENKSSCIKPSHFYLLRLPSDALQSFHRKTLPSALISQLPIYNHPHGLSSLNQEYTALYKTTLTIMSRDLNIHWQNLLL